MHTKLKYINLALQALLIKKKCPNWKCYTKNNKLTCRGNVKPSELSKMYIIELNYVLKTSPKVTVIDPLLERNSAGEKPRHLYKDNLLCLYHPWKNEWDGSKVIAETIIPWVSLWLYYYEVWLATGSWKGEGEHPHQNESIL